MAKNFSVALNMILNSADYTQGLKAVRKETEEFRKSFEEFSGGIKNLLGIGAAALTVESAFEVLKKGFESTIQSADTYEGVVKAISSATDVFFRTVANGDWSNLIGNMQRAGQAGREYAESLLLIRDAQQGTDLANAKDAVRLAQIKIDVIKAKLLGAAGSDEVKRLVEEFMKIKNDQLDRNAKLIEDKIGAEVKNLSSRGITKASIIDYASHGEEAAKLKEINAEYAGLISKKKQLETNVSSGGQIAGGASIYVPISEEQTKAIEKVDEDIRKLVANNPRLLEFHKLLTTADDKELTNVNRLLVEQQNVITTNLEARKRLEKSLVTAQLAGDKTDDKAAKEKQALLDKTGLLNELNAKLKEFTALRDQSTTLTGEIKYGLAVDALKEQIKELNSELEKTIKNINDSRLLKPKFSGAVSELPSTIPGLQSSSTIGGQIQHATDKVNGKDANADMKDGLSKFEDQKKAIESALQSSIAEIGVSLGEAFGQMLSGASGAKAFEDFGKAMLGSIGKFITEVGKALVAYSAAMIAFKFGIEDPFVAMAAGIALITLGTAFTSLVSGGLGSSAASASSAGGSSGGNYTSAASSSQAYNTNTQSPEIKVSGEFVLDGYKLKAVIGNVDRRNLSIG